MKAGIESFVKDLESADMKDAVNMLVGMLAGPKSLDPTDPDNMEKGKSFYKLAKIGMSAVMLKKDLIGILRESGPGTDDTMLEDDLVISGN